MGYADRATQPPYYRASNPAVVQPEHQFTDDWAEMKKWLVGSPDIAARYSYVLSFKAPDMLISLANLPARLGSDKIRLQEIKDSTGDAVNIDYYSVEFSPKNMPTSLDALFTFFRLHLNAFLIANVWLDDARTFVPHSRIEELIWEKEQPLGAIIDIISGRVGPFYDDMTVLASDVCSQKSMGAYWIFSTLWSEWNEYHPVSGNRLFGIETSGAKKDKITFYASGVDGLTSTNTSVIDPAVDWLLSRIKLGDKFWRTFFTNLVTALRRIDANAKFNKPIRATAKKADLDAFFKTNVFP